MDYSIVIPAYNEEKNIKPLYKKVANVMQRLGGIYEIVFIDDGSKDNTLKELLDLYKEDPKHIKVIKFRRNFGQTPAWRAGFDLARGDIVFAMDADLQNDPEDIPRLLDKLNEGYDVVSGWRADRKDPFCKKIASKLANRLRKLMTGERIHDSGCSLKVYKRECLEDLELYGEMHRFITALLTWKGYRVGEIKVKHHQRKHGQTKYTTKRIIKGFLDLLVVKFWMQYSARPIHLFGGIGAILALAGALIGIYLGAIRIFFYVSLADKTVLPLLSILCIILGVQFIMTGIIADIVSKNYYANKKSYAIDKIYQKKGNEDSVIE